MLSTIKGYLLGGLVLVVVLSSVGNLIGLYKVHDKLTAAENLRVEAAQEKTFQEVNGALENAIKEIDERTDRSKETLEVILNDARKEGASQARPVPTIVRIESQPTAQAATTNVGSNKSGPSGTTLRTIDSLWDNYCTTFPNAGDCKGRTTGQEAVRSSSTPVKGGG